MDTAEQLRVELPASFEEAAELLRAAAADAHAVRPRGGGTKLGWGVPRSADVELRTEGLDRVLEHNAGDLTAVLEAGVPFADAQAAFAQAGQRLALDPPAAGGAPTIGGVIATADSGPLRHRYGAPRDLVLGIAVALSDGSIARAGGKVIKNVAGYDLAKLFAGSFGTLGVVLEVAVRLHPLPPRTLTVRAGAHEPDALRRIAAALAHAPLELEALDVAWARGRGAALARLGGAQLEERSRDVLEVVAAAAGEGDVVEDDESLWAAQREHQRSPDGAVVRVSTLQAKLPDVIQAAERLDATVVGRAALGVFWVALPAAEPAALAAAVEELRLVLAPDPCVLLDAPAEVREAIDPWDEPHEGPRAALMRRLKARFDPAGACNPGTYAAGI